MKRLAVDAEDPIKPTEGFTPKMVAVYQRGRSVGDTTVNVLVGRGNAVSATPFGAAATNGSALNGSALNGSALNGSALNGSALNGSALSGSALSGSALSGSALSAIAKQVANRVRYQFQEMPDVSAMVMNSPGTIAESSLTKADYDKAFRAFESHSLLQDPFYAKQFARKHAQREHVLNSYNLSTAQALKRDCYPGWVASDPVGALNKRADRDQILYVMDNGERRYPLEQFDAYAKSPKLTHAFATVIDAVKTIGGISQEELLYWLAAEHGLPVATESAIDQAIEAGDSDAAWQAIRDAAPRVQNFVCPLELLKRGETQTVLHLLNEWAEIKQDKPAPSRTDVIDAIKALMAVEHIDLDDLKDRL